MTLRSLSIKYSVPRETLRKRINGDILGHDHMSGGGKGVPKLLTLDVERKYLALK